MNANNSRNLRHVFACTFLILTCAFVVTAQQKPVVLQPAQLTRIVPSGFYFQGQSAPTQMRNAAAVRLGDDRYIIAALVDTSGYSAEIRAKYEGFFITDAPVEVGGETLQTGAYGFGFTDDGKMNVFDIGGREVLSVNTKSDRALRRPRPLMMINSADGVRLYSGRAYVLLTAR